MKKFFILPLLISFSILLSAQEQTEEGAITEIMLSENWFNNLQKAKANPLEVWYLDLSLQKLKTFPAEIFTFKNLQQLYVPYNYWTSIPDEISSLTKLRILDLSGNYYLNKLPMQALAKMKHHEKIIIKDNKLAAGEIEKLRKLLPKTKIITK